MKRGQASPRPITWPINVKFEDPAHRAEMDIGRVQWFVGYDDRIDWRAVIVNALALAYILFCGLVVLWWLT